MQPSRLVRTVAGVAALALIATACGGDDDDEPGAVTSPTPAESPTEAESPTPAEVVTAPAARVNETLKIGTIIPQTGDLAILGPPQGEAVKLAVSQINEAGGILGKDLELAEGDSGTNEEVANNAADRMIQSELVDAIIGAASSRISLSIIDKVTGSETVQCSPSNTSATFTTYEDADPGFYFRTAPPDNLQGPALADVIVGDGHATVSIIALNDAYGQGFADFLSQALEGSGAEVVANVAYDPQGTDFSGDVQQALEADPDAIALISFPETGTRIITNLLEEGVSPDQLYTADGMQDGAVIGEVAPDDPAALNGTKGTAPSSQGSEEFAQAFQEFAPPDTPSIFSAHAYDCAVIIALAAQVAGTDDPREFGQEMVGVTRDGETCTDPASCLELIEQGTDIDYDGASGPGEWIPAGEPSAGDYEVWEFRDGEVESLDIVFVGEEQ